MVTIYELKCIVASKRHNGRDGNKNTVKFSLQAFVEYISVLRLYSLDYTVR